MLRTATEAERRSWPGARARLHSSPASDVLWRGAKVLAFAVGFDWGDIDDDVDTTAVGAGAVAAKVLVATLDGAPRDHLLVEPSAGRTGALRGSLSFPPDGLLWQPSRAAGRGILIASASIRGIATGLPGHGVLLQLVDGRLGFTVRRRDAGQTLAALESRCGRALDHRP
jgi:hypothetical protein